MADMANPIGTIEHGECKAEIFEQAMPGQFTVVYRSASGEVLEESELTGVSTYRQREAEITERLQQLCRGEKPPPSDDLAAAGEY